MRILIVNKRAPFEGRGAEQVIWRIGKHLAEHGHRIRFFCPTPTSNRPIPELAGIDFSFVETGSEPTRSMIEFFLRGSVSYRSVYSSFKPDLVYDNPSPFPFHMAHVYGDAAVISKVHAVYRGLAFLCKEHPLVKVGTIVGEETYRAFRDEAFVTNSESTAERLRELIDTERNEVIANPIGIDAEEFEFGVPEDSKQVVSISKLSPRKRIGDLLDAWEHVEQSHPDASLTIAGSGPLEDDLRQQAEDLGLGTVTFAGFVSEDEKRRLLTESAVFAAPTLYEGFGLSVLEAMASGCVVVGSNTWGLKDYLNHGENGLLVPPRDPKALADGIVTALDDSDLRLAISQSAKQTTERYSMEASLERDLQCIEENFYGDGQSA